MKKSILVNGVIYDSISKACNEYNIPTSTVCDNLKLHGKFKRDGVEITIAPEDKNKNKKSASIIKKLNDLYSEKEIKALLKGRGFHKEMSIKKLELNGKKHRLMVMSDTHIGSVYCPEDYIKTILELAKDENCEAILHCGDLVEGLTPRRIATQIYELTDIGYKAQRDKAVKLFSQTSLPMFVISGNHDMYFKEYAGANIVEDIAERIPNMTYLGHDIQDIEIDGITIRLFHGSDGSGASTSYRLQRVIESLDEKDLPDILLAGHVHKYCSCIDRNVYAFSIPSVQLQSGFMASKRLKADVGCMILEFESNDGKLTNFNIKYYPFYN